MAKTKISQFDATASNNTDLNSISIAEGTAPSNINNAIRELMSQLADLNLGNEVLSTLKIDNLHLDGNTIVTLDTNGDLNLTPNGTGAVTIAKADINGGTIDGTPIGASSASTGAFSTLSASSTANLGSTVTISGGNIDGVIGANTPAAITGTVITANTNFAGNLTGNVTGTVDGVVGGTTPAAVTGTTITANTKFVGAIDGNVTATSGTSTFNNVTINGTLDMDSTTSQTITGLATPSGSTDAATKGYVDTEVSGLVDSAPAALNTLNELAAALGDDASFSTTVTNSIAAKLPLAGGTMTGDIDANSNTVSGLKAPSASNDATTKTYVDTADALKLNLSGGTLSGNLAMGSNKVTGLDTPTATGDATTKGYVDGILGSATAAATSASAASTSQTAAATSATASATSATASAASATSAAASYDSFDDRYLGAKGSAPTVDNDGDALLTGALYFNTSSNQLFIWSGSAWTQAAFTASGFLSGANNLSDVANAGTSRTNLGLGTAATTASTDYATAAQGTKADNAAAKASNLSDLASASTARTNLGLGSAATLTAGTSANNAVQLDGSAKLPAVDGSALTGLASGGTVNMVADGAIAIRKPVVLTAAGKAKEVAETSTPDTNPSFNFQEAATNTTGNDPTSTYEATSGAYVIAWKESSNGYGYVMAGTISNGTMTWGTPTAFLSSTIDSVPNICSGDGAVHITYRSGTNGVIKWGTISGTTITLASGGDLFNHGGSYTNPNGYRCAYDTANNYVMVFYSGEDNLNSYVQPMYYNSTAGTYTGSTSALVKSSVQITTATSEIVYDSDTERCVVFYRDTQNSNLGYANVIQGTGTSSSPTVSVGSASNFTNSDEIVSYGNIGGIYDTQNDKIFIAWNNTDGSNPSWRGAIITVTGGSTNTIASTGWADIWDYAGGGSRGAIAFDSDKNKIMFYYRDDGNSDYLTYKTITSGASSFTVADGSVIKESDNQFQGNSPSFAPSKGVVLPTRDLGNSGKVSSVTTYYNVVTSSNLDNGNYLGISAEAISDTATGKINVIGGTSTGHSSLTIGNHYFTNGAGTVGLVGDSNGEQYLGRAISATEIQLLENEGYLYGTAEGAVTAGKPVIIEADGDFAQAKTTTNSISFSKGSETSIQASVTSTYGFTSYNTAQDKFVCFYEDRGASSYLYGNVISNDGTTLTAGSKSSAGNNFNTRILSVIYIGDSKHIIFMRNDDNNYFAAVVATVSGTSISYGTVNTFHSYSNHFRGTAYWDSDKNVPVFVGCYNASSKNLAAYSFTVSGTTLTKTEGATDNSQGVVNYVDSAYDSTNKIGVVAYTDGSDDGYVTTLSVTSAGALTWNTSGEAQVSGSNNLAYSGFGMTYDSANEKTILIYKNESTNNYAYTVPITVSGNPATTVAIGSATDVTGVAVFSDEMSAIATDYGAIAYTYIQNSVYSYIKYKQGDASGSTISISGADNLVSGSDYYDAPPLAFNPTDNVIAGAYRNGSDDDVDAVAFIASGSVSSSNLTAENYLGVATKTVADDAQVEVATFGQIDAQQSGLTAGQKYFVQSDGSLGTSADSSVTTVAGKALSATKLLISE